MIHIDAIDRALEEEKGMDLRSFSTYLAYSLHSCSVAVYPAF